MRPTLFDGVIGNVSSGRLPSQDVTDDVDGRVIGGSDAVLRTAMPGHDDGEIAVSAARTIAFGPGLEKALARDQLV